MRTGEAVPIKCYDSAEAGTARFTAQTAFQDPTTSADVVPRESIEARALSPAAAGSATDGSCRAAARRPPCAMKRSCQCHTVTLLCKRSVRTGRWVLATAADDAHYGGRVSGEPVSGGGADRIGGLPVPGQQFGNAFGGVVGDPREDVGEIGLRIEAVELCRLDQ
jgi:hypothetical protein